MTDRYQSAWRNLALDGVKEQLALGLDPWRSIDWRPVWFAMFTGPASDKQVVAFYNAVVEMYRANREWRVYWCIQRPDVNELSADNVLRMIYLRPHMPRLLKFTNWDRICGHPLFVSNIFRAAKFGACYVRYCTHNMFKRVHLMKPEQQYIARNNREWFTYLLAHNKWHVVIPTFAHITHEWQVEAIEKVIEHEVIDQHWKLLSILGKACHSVIINRLCLLRNRDMRTLELWPFTPSSIQLSAKRQIAYARHLGHYREHACLTLLMACVSDGRFILREEQKTNSLRFFRIAEQLPIEMQMWLASVTFNTSEQLVSSRDIESACIWLVRWC